MPKSQSHPASPCTAAAAQCQTSRYAIVPCPHKALHHKVTKSPLSWLWVNLLYHSPIRDLLFRVSYTPEPPKESQKYAEDGDGQGKGVCRGQFHAHGHHLETNQPSRGDGGWSQFGWSRANASSNIIKSVPKYPRISTVSSRRPMMTRARISADPLVAVCGRLTRTVLGASTLCVLERCPPPTQKRPQENAPTNAAIPTHITDYRLQLRSSLPEAISRPRPPRPGQKQQATAYSPAPWRIRTGARPFEE